MIIFRTTLLTFFCPGRTYSCTLLLSTKLPPPGVCNVFVNRTWFQYFFHRQLIFVSNQTNISFRPNIFVGSVAGSALYSKWYFEVKKNLFRLLIYSLSLGSGWYLKKGGDQIKESTLRLLYVSKYHHHHHHRHPFQDVWFTCWTSGCHWPCGTAVWHGTTLQSRLGKVGTLFKELGWGKWELDVFLYQTTRRKTCASSSGKVGSFCTKLAFEHNTKTI